MGENKIMQEVKWKTRAQLKSEAKELYRGKWIDAIKLNLIPIIFKVILVLILLISMLNTLITLNDSSQVQQVNMPFFFQIFVLIVIVNFFNFIISKMIFLINVSIGYTMVDWLRKKEESNITFKNAFISLSKNYYVGNIVIEGLTFMFLYFWYILFVIPGFIKRFSYSQAQYIFKDITDTDPNSNISYLDCITKSKKLMNGHKWRLFCLQLSFIGWEILSSICLGIGHIWLTPYKKATYAAFYNELSEGIAEASE